MRIDRSFSLLVAFLFIGIAPGIRAQIPVSVHAEAVDLKSMSHRTLIVEIVDEDERISVDFPKKQAEQMMTDYRADVANYNALMQKAVNQYWKFNTKIEFKHSSEIRKLFESESSKYVALVKGSVTGEGPLWGPTTGVPCLMFQRTDQKSKPAFKGRVLAFNKLDYGIFLPSANIRAGKAYLECDIKFALVQMQKNLRANQSMDKANNFHEYAKNEAEAKCGKLKGMKLMFEEEFLYKSQTLDEVKESYTWPIEFASAKEINDACMKGAPGKAVLIDVPCGTTVSPEDDGIAYMKVIIDPNTDEILQCLYPGMGNCVSHQLMKADLKEIGRCK